MPDSRLSAPRRVNLDRYLAEPSRALREFSRLHAADAPLTVFDIGCCEGEDAIRFSRHFTRSRVFAFEALPDNQRICRENFAHYDATRVELVPAALCDRVGFTDFHVSSGSPDSDAAANADPDWNHGNKSSSVLPPRDQDAMHGWISFRQKITIPCLTLDHFCHERAITRVDLAHMDVQGAESLVLAGAARTLPHLGALWLEVSAKEFYVGQRLKDELGETLRAAGFFRLREFMRADGEGDQLWLNQRHPRTWLRRLTAAAGDLKYRLAHHVRPRSHR